MVVPDELRDIGAAPARSRERAEAVTA